MDFLATDAAAERARTRWLIRLRWMAVLGVLSALLVSGPFLEILEDATAIVLIAAALAVWNTYLAIRWRRGVSRQPAKAQIAVDLAVLTAMLFFAGGLRNPFSVFLVIQVILGAILLPGRPAVLLGTAAIVSTIGLAVADATSVLPPLEQVFRLERNEKLPLWAVATAIAISMAVALRFVTDLMGDLREKAADASRYFEEARRERLRLRNIVRNVGAGLVLLDRDGRVAWRNRAAMDVLGVLPPDETFRLPGIEAGWPELESFETEEAVTRALQIPVEGGPPRFHQLVASVIRGPEGEIDQIAVVVTDVTERRAALVQLQRAEKLAALGRLAAGVAHEINTPLGSVSIQTSEARAMLARVAEGDEEAARTVAGFLDDIRSETTRISGLVRRLLDAGHPGGGQSVDIDVSHLVSDAVRLISVREGRNSPLVRTDFGEGSMRLHTDADRLRQVLLNLLDNALDAVRGTDGTVVVSTREEGEGLSIEVRDEGTGIEEADLQRVFDPFFTTKEVGEGTGLGLYVSHEIVKSLGGAIDIESRPGEGTRVRIRLPRAASRGAEAKT